MAETVFTAPLAIIKVTDPLTNQLVTVGKMRNLRVSETIRRGRVTGIGQMNAIEVPAVEFTGTLTCGFYMIDFSKHPFMRNAILRRTDGPVNMLNNLLVQEIGLTIDIKRNTLTGYDANGIALLKDETFAVISRAFITSDGFDISEGQISGQDSTFEYLDPINYMLAQ